MITPRQKMNSEIMSKSYGVAVVITGTFLVFFILLYSRVPTWVLSLFYARYDSLVISSIILFVLSVGGYFLEKRATKLSAFLFPLYFMIILPVEPYRIPLLMGIPIALTMVVLGRGISLIYSILFIIEITVFWIIRLGIHTEGMIIGGIIPYTLFVSVFYLISAVIFYEIEMVFHRYEKEGLEIAAAREMLQKKAESQIQVIDEQKDQMTTAELQRQKLNDKLEDMRNRIEELKKMSTHSVI